MDGTTTRINQFGNRVTEEFCEGDRYHYDFLFQKEPGWRQYDTDQDASYFGIWVNVEKRTIFTFCEGDTIFTKCPTLDTFKAELDHMAEFYGDPPPAFTVIDDLTGAVTYIYDERPAV